MKALLLHPLFPMSYWSYEGMLKLIGRKTLLPPLSLVTVAAILPDEWEFKLVDCNAEDLQESHWEWADIVLISGMIVQKDHMLALIRESKSRAKPTVVGGPYLTSVPEDAIDAGADFLVLDEGEITIPMFLEALARGETGGVFRAGEERADMTQSPIPRFDLLDFSLYSEMSLQFSRGCPFLCEFCDIIKLFGRKPRTKTPDQIIAELQSLYDLGWRRSMFLVDDNFIGNKPKVKPLLHRIIEWQKQHDYPFSITTEASLNLAEDEEMMELMRQAYFGTVFLGIETPDADSLALTKKTQNLRSSLADQVKTINKAGLRVIGSFILGFDGEKSGAGQRIMDFVDDAAIPHVMVNILHALPATDLTERLIREGRMLDDEEIGNISQGKLCNFVTTRPLRELAAEHMEANYQVYEPERFLSRAYRHSLNLRERPKRKKNPLPPLNEIKVLFIILWRQGVKRSSRGVFWRSLFSILRKKPDAIRPFMIACAHFEHFYEYRNKIREEIQAHIDQLTDEALDRVAKMEDVSVIPMKKPKKKQSGSTTVTFTPHKVG